MTRADAALTRANHRLFHHFGEQAVLRDTIPHTVIITEDVEIIGEYGQVEQHVTTAAFLIPAGSPHAPRPADRLTVQTGEHAGTYTIDRPIKRPANHGVREWILIPATTAAP